MKGFVFFEPGRGEVKEIAIGHPKPKEVLIKVAYCGICGTDMNIWRGTDRSEKNVILGHEFCGTIVETGNEVTDFQPGDRVAVDPNIPCGTCEQCRNGRINLCTSLNALGVDRNGGFAEYCLVPETQLFSIPDHMSFETAAMVEPVSCAINGINRVDIHIGDDVLVLGGGPMGLIMLQLAKLRGAGRVILCERLEKRRKTARKMGADDVIQDLETLSSILPSGPDVVIECIGNPITQEQSLQVVKAGGKVELFGDGDMTRRFSVPSMLFYEKELTVSGAALNPYTHLQALKIIASGKIDVASLISGKIPVEQLQDTLNRGYGEQDVKILAAF